MSRRLLACCFLFASLIATAAVQAQVKASLVAAEQSVQPGRPFTVALRLEHDPHWHTYWINPGTGYATSITWKLPAGWTAGEIQWPTPVLLKDKKGNVVGNGYEGEILLPVTITPAKEATPGSTVTLTGKAEWLMCLDTCVPGDSPIELSLPVQANPPAPDAAWAPKFAALPMPSPSTDWTFAARHDDKTVTLTLTSSAGRSLELKDPFFFSLDGLVQYDQPQNVRRTSNGYEFILPLADTYEGDKKRLVGVLSTQSPLRGISIDVPLGGSNASGGAATAGNAGGAAEAKSVTAGAIALAVLGGLILNLMPCVFPVLGIKILGFVNQAGADRRKVTLHGLVFTAGVLASFWTLAGVLAVLRAGGAELGWGYQLQSPTFVFGLAVVMLVFALSMSGVFEFGLRATGVGANLQSKSGYSGSFFTGVLATVVATPCSAPFLAPALGAAVTLPLQGSFILFTAIALGLSTPYLLLSIFPNAVRLLPRPGAWMETFKQLMAFPLYGTAAYLVWVLAGQLKDHDSDLLMVLLGLTVIAFGVWWYGHYTAPGAKPGRARLGTIGGIALIAIGAFVGWPREAVAGEIEWEPWSAQRVAELRAQNRTIYVDFTARWCFTCQTNKKLVFGSGDVRKLFREKKVATLKGDWTNRDPKITAELAKWQRSAVPFNLIYKPGAKDPVVLPEVLTAGTVLDALK